MNNYYQHTDPEVFPNPFEWQPERWLPTPTPEMKRNFTVFSRGSRRCPGQSLAMAELTFALATIFRPGGPKFKLFETDRSDIEGKHDCIMPLPKLDSKGVRAQF
ncbi:Trichodiene oxygenase-like protein [Hapsidospora chrysogenum ATCC 11550]|uniref:Trichodiene oxygenase-like protein n=1 Tax=Hapsidospora chrysogenum (strain ATCC 11550 / CBS 779.69 / DSM 880 / IAM 14645 / JCM 23072 / IMI 49137) TaxID=857340 RepID=A0A086T3S2_HAPC1|nr:Trichodiene oxygenase-like protein [Hapsidospora chrysogenum ATCC 11550]